MIRAAMIVLSTICVVAVLAELAGVTYLWSNGNLTPDTWQDVQTAVFGEDDTTVEEEEEVFQPQPTLRDLMSERIKGFLELSSRESELAAIKDNLTSEADLLLANQDAFEKKRVSFQDQLKQLDSSSSSAAIEQARGVLSAMQPADAVLQLMQVEPDEAVTILRGLPEKNIAKILQEFQNGGDPEQMDRGRLIFQAITRGGQKKNLIDGELDQAPATAATDGFPEA